MVICKEIDMIITKNQVLQKINKSKFLTQKGNFVFRVSKLIKDGEFNKALPSRDLVALLNEGPWKKVKVTSLNALMIPLQKEDIVKVKILNTKKYWLPGWIDKNKAEDELFLYPSENKVFFLTGKDAWTDSNKSLLDIIKVLDGDLCIVDPFYGNGTFYTLAKFGKLKKIRFLSGQLGKEEQNNINNFNINLKKFKKEFENIKMKRYDKFYELHDRYIISKNALVVIGHGIKDFGNKESFVIFLPKRLVSRFLPILKKAFDERWKKSNDIT